MRRSDDRLRGRCDPSTSLGPRDRSGESPHRRFDPSDLLHRCEPVCRRAAGRRLRRNRGRRPRGPAGVSRARGPDHPARIRNVALRCRDRSRRGPGHDPIPSHFGVRSGATAHPRRARHPACRVECVSRGARNAIRSSRRPIRKHSCGYDLVGPSESLARGVFPLASLFVGSEGTLGVVTEVTLRVLPVPARRVTMLLYLDRFEDLGPAVADILTWGPSAIEAVDGDSLALLDREALGIPRTAKAMLLVEFDEGDPDAIADAVVRRVATRYRMSRDAEVASDPVRQSTLWKVRRSLFPTIIQRPGPRKAWGFVEDPIVPRDRVPEFIAFLVDLTRRYGTTAGIYGHIGDGNTHYRPFFDPTDPQDFERMRALREEFDHTVLNRFRGAPSGEHGIGRIRAETLPRVWGSEVYGVMRRIKEALDPRGLLNPGVLFSSDPWWATWGGLESRVPM